MQGHFLFLVSFICDAWMGQKQTEFELHYHVLHSADMRAEEKYLQGFTLKSLWQSKDRAAVI